MNYFLNFSYCSKSFDINLHNWLLKNTADFICVSLCKLFNKSLSTGALPFDWVSGNVVPVHKHNEEHNPCNYRPISLTSVLIKVFEQIIHHHLVCILERHHLISPSQSGFRRKRSTVRPSLIYCLWRPLVQHKLMRAGGGY